MLRVSVLENVSWACSAINLGSAYRADTDSPEGIGARGTPVGRNGEGLRSLRDQESPSIKNQIAGGLRECQALRGFECPYLIIGAVASCVASMDAPAPAQTSIGTQRDSRAAFDGFGSR